jgi:NAD(P)-dependent dehydrogenase (short-subunit alcohol dehydrogenase family)
MLISRGILTRQTLAGKVAIVTGAGGGIGYEACRSLLWLGAKVIVAEVNKQNGQESIRRLNQEFGNDLAFFVHTDVGDEKSILKLATQAFRHYGKVDIVLNNATVAPLGAVKDVAIATWDLSYRVNLRGPVLLARAFLPGMIERKYGVFACVSSLGTAFMGAYEAMKAAQVHLGSTLDAELENTGVYAFTIGPGFVPTETALSAIPKLASMMGISLDTLQTTLKDHTISIESAGAGFAAAIALAEKFHGQEISSPAGLAAAGVDTQVGVAETPTFTIEQYAQILALSHKIRTTLAEQYQGYKQRSIFEQQWIQRTFKKCAGVSIDDALDKLSKVEQASQACDGVGLLNANLHPDGLAAYHAHMNEMAKGYIKDPIEREKNQAIVRGWQADAEELGKLL